MSSSLSLVVFQEQQHWFGIEAAFISGQGRWNATVEQQAISSMLNLAQLLRSFSSSTTTSVPPITVPTNYWLALAPCSVPDPTKNQPKFLGLTAEAELIELATQSIRPLPKVLQLQCRLVALQALAWYTPPRQTDPVLLNLLDARKLLATV